MKPVAKSPPKAVAPRPKKSAKRLLAFIPIFVRHDGTIAKYFPPIKAATFQEAFAHPLIKDQASEHGRMAILGVQTKMRVSLIKRDGRAK